MMRKYRLSTILVDGFCVQQRDKQLHMDDRKYRSFFDNSADAMLIIENGVFVACNSATVSMLGYDRKEEFINTPPSKLSPEYQPDGQSSFNKANEMMRLARDNGNHRFEWDHLRKDGSIIPVEVSLTAIGTDNGSQLHTVWRDVSARKLAENALQASEKRLSMLVECAPEAIFVRDKSCFIYLNSAAVKLFGANSAQDLIGTQTIERYHPKDREDIRERMQILNDQSLDAPLKQSICLQLDGTEVNVESSAVPMNYQGKDGTLVFMRDITDRVEEQKRHRQFEMQLHQSQKMEAIGTMAGGIAHDFNNLLAIIGGNLELINLRSLAGKPFDENLEHIKEASVRAKHLVAQILAFSRQEKQERVPINLTALVSESLNFLRPMIPTTVEVMTEVPEYSVSINADTTQLQQVLINLCSNAIHAMNDKGLLRISLVETKLTAQEVPLTVDLHADRYAKLSVSDTGKGMDKVTLDRIFDPFFTTKEVGIGTGMGLSVTHGVVEQHEGFIQVASTPGQGTTFTLYFPVTTNIEATEETEEETDLPTGTESVLFVDDEQYVAKACGGMLEHLGYKVTVVTESVEALDLFKAHPDDFDLVITDQTMPKMSGVELAKELLKIRPDIPIILCSGYSAQITDGEALGIGIYSFCQKPITIKQLATVAREALDTSK